MTNKEILAELKICYELLNDIRDNHEGRFDEEEESITYKMESDLDDLYSKIYNLSLEDEEEKANLKIKELEDKDIIIADNIYTDYDIVKKGTIEKQEDEYKESEYLTCKDLGYTWYFDELGYRHNNFEYDKLANGFMKALDEICQLSKEVGKDFDYFDKASELVDFNNSDTLELLDEYGSDNDE